MQWFSSKHPINVHLAHIYFYILHQKTATETSHSWWYLQAKRGHKVRKTLNKQASNKPLPFNADFKTFMPFLNLNSQKDLHHALGGCSCFFPNIKCMLGYINGHLKCSFAHRQKIIFLHYIQSFHDEKPWFLPPWIWLNQLLTFFFWVIRSILSPLNK